MANENFLKKNILGIIPARGGSKGIPRKNIKPLHGKPLIYYTIKEALKSKFLNRVVVSTEDNDIAEIAKKFGAKVIKRPKELARDETPIRDVVIHVLNKFKEKKYIPDAVVLLQPSSPLRKAHHIDEAISLFFHENCDFVVSVCESKKPPYWYFIAEGNYLRPLLKPDDSWSGRQDLPKTYIPNGALYISTPEKLYKFSNYYNGKIVPYVMSMEESVDIDDELDFILAEKLMERKK